jgi:hypothetical protein
MADAPVSYDNPTKAPATQPPTIKPFVPHAVDMASTITAVNALNQVVNAKPTTRWTELERHEEKIRITNPNDDTMYVDVIRITRLVFEDNRTKDRLLWQLTNANPT